jgi:predicted ribosome quality control (RQC) complex YloA/Tae2 family protein
MATQTEQKYGIDNLTYDIVTVLHEKAKGLEAYNEYLKDAQGDQKCTQLFQRLQQQDRQAVQELQQHLKELLSGAGQGRQAA